MPARKPRPADEKPQSERFIETARELGVPEDEATYEAFKEKLGQIARHKPEGEAPDGGAAHHEGGRSTSSVAKAR